MILSTMVGVFDWVSRFRFLPEVGVEAATDDGRTGVDGDAKDLRSGMGEF